MENPEKLITQGKHNDEKQSTTHYVLDTTIRKQTQIKSIRHGPSYKQSQARIRNRENMNFTSPSTRIYSDTNITCKKEIRTTNTNPKCHRGIRLFWLGRSKLKFITNNEMYSSEVISINNTDCSVYQYSRTVTFNNRNYPMFHLVKKSLKIPKR